MITYMEYAIQFIISIYIYIISIYYSVISLTTIGFGDLIPRNEPPITQATHVKNESACLCELINPVPSNDVNNKTGLSKLCNPVS